MKVKGTKQHLIIDAYNVLHAWEETAKHMKNRSVESAREKLIQLAKVIHDNVNARVTLVFDGQGQKVDIQEFPDAKDLAVIYSPSGVSADVIIERIAANQKGGGAVYVVSEDNMIAASIRASGAFLMDTFALLDWADRCQNEQASHLKKHQQTQKSKSMHTLADFLP